MTQATAKTYARLRRLRSAGKPLVLLSLDPSWIPRMEENGCTAYWEHAASFTRHLQELTLEQTSTVANRT